MKVTVFTLACIMLFVPAAALAGDLNPTAAPASTSSHTLENIYNRLDTGADGSESTFTEPGAVPGDTGTGHTLNEIMDKAPALEATDGAMPADVAMDKTFWGLTSGGGWGLQTGAYEEPAPTCSGTSYGDTERWCDNDDGTVTDMTTGLVWLKNAKCTGTLAAINNSTGKLEWSNAVIWSSAVKDGVCGLSDSSAEGDWRLPTKSELAGITTEDDDDAVSSSEQQAFGTSVQDNRYWTSTSLSVYPPNAWNVVLGNGDVFGGGKTTAYCVWPVRGGQ